MSEEISTFELLPKVVPLILWVSESGVTMCIDIQFIISLPYYKEAQMWETSEI